MGCDRISELPDSLLTQILSYFPTKDSVKTSVLSTRWQFLWLKVPGLDLNAIDFPLNGEVFASFMEKFLEFNHKSRMQKFKIKYNEFNNYRDRFVELISTVLDRGIRHLEVEADIFPCNRDFMPHNIYKSKTLVFLKLVSVGIKNPEFVVSLPCLKIMHLEDIRYEDDPLIMEKLILGCPVLEDLTVVRPIDLYNLEVVLLFLRVRSQTLKRFRFTFANNMGGTAFSVEIDAPRLEYLSFRDNQSDWIVVKNLSSLFMIDIDTEFNVKFGGSLLEPEDLSKRDIIRNFLTSISTVRHMIISRRTLEVLYRYSKLGPIPEFRNLHRLQATLSSSLLPQLPVFLEICPNLNNLILDFDVSAQPEQIELSYVPQCLLLTLEYVEIKELITKEEAGVKLVRPLMPLDIYNYKTLLSFKLVNVPSLYLVPRSFVYGEARLRQLCSEDLIVVRNLDDNVAVLRVSS